MTVMEGATVFQEQPCKPYSLVPFGVRDKDGCSWAVCRAFLPTFSPCGAIYCVGGRTCFFIHTVALRGLQAFCRHLGSDSLPYMGPWSHISSAGINLRTQALRTKTFSGKAIASACAKSALVLGWSLVLFFGFFCL